MHPFTIATDGDENEKGWWPQWTADYFPSYEAFWASRIAPLTYRVKHRQNVRFQTNAELAAAGYTDEDVAVAQLHYTILRHLGRVFELLDDARAFTNPIADGSFAQDQFFESFARLSGVSDLADEILSRRATPGKYLAWDERSGSAARKAWRRPPQPEPPRPDPLRPVRTYRNRLVHGRVVPEIWVKIYNPAGTYLGDMLFYPRLGTVDKYLDWRIASAVTDPLSSPDFDQAALIAAEAWKAVVGHVEQAWQTHLLPNL